MASKKANRPHRSKPYENKVAERRIVRNPAMAKRNPQDQMGGNEGRPLPSGESQVSQTAQDESGTGPQPERTPQKFNH